MIQALVNFGISEVDSLWNHHTKLLISISVVLCSSSLQEKIYEVDVKSVLLSDSLLQLIAVAIVEEPKSMAYFYFVSGINALN